MADEQATIKVTIGPVGLDIPIPLKNLFRWFRSEVKILHYGAPGTGKTSFRRALQNAAIEEIRKTGRTTALVEEEFKYVHTNGPGKFELTLQCMDAPGGQQQRRNIFDDLLDNPPLVIFVFVDHYDTRKKLFKDLPPHPTESKIRQWEADNRTVLRKADPRRIEENRLAIRDLYKGLSTHQVLHDACCLLVPIVTKQDLWKDFHHEHYFYDQYHRDLDVFESKLQIPVTKIMPCSTIININNGVYAIMRLVERETEKDRGAWNRFKKFLARKHS
jgi:GTPase SAR1 family protein